MYSTVSAQCDLSSNFQIDDFSTTSVSISVEDAINNDLANTAQGVCGVFIELEHTHIGDLLVELISPEGQSVSLIGSVVNSGNTSATNWNVFFTSCTSPPSPDAGFAPVWDNNQNWGILGNYSGTYYPFQGCLEDFNTGPVNGLWSLKITDANLFDVGTILNFSIVFCDIEGIECIDCFELEAASNIKPDTLNCIKKSITLDFETDFLFDSLQWSGPNGFESTAFQPIIAEQGMYQVSAFYKSLCVVEKNVIINLDTIKPQINTADGYFDCYEAFDTLILFDTDFMNVYSWEGPANFKSEDKNPVVYSGGNYFVTVTGQNGCTSNSNLNVEANTSNPNLSVDDFIFPCNTDSIKIFADISNPSATVTWEGPNSFFSTEKEPMVADTGNYIVTITTDFNGCSSTDSLQVTPSLDVPDFNILQIGALDCSSDSLILVPQDIDDDLSFYWKDESGSTSLEDSLYVYNSSNIGLYVTGANLCVDSQFIQLTYDTLKPTININSEGYIKCDQLDMKLDAEGSSNGEFFDYEWSTISGEIIGSTNSFDANIKGDGTYYFQITNKQNHCNTKDSIEIIALENNMHDLTAIISHPSCSEIDNGTIKATEVLGGTPPFNYSLNESEYEPNDFFTGLGAGDFILSVKDQDGCKLFTTAVLIDQPDFLVDLGPDMMVDYGEEVEITVNISIDNAEIDSILWAPEMLTNCINCSQIDFMFENNQEIQVTVSDTAGCSVSDGLFITVNVSEDVYIPNIFSPNGDGQNDYFYVQAGGGVEKINEMIIFDKRGIPYFQTEDINVNIQEEGWDGRWEGKKANTGVYIYYIEVLLKSGQIVSFASDLTLIR